MEIKQTNKERFVAYIRNSWTEFLFGIYLFLIFAAGIQVSSMPGKRNRQGDISFEMLGLCVIVLLVPKIRKLVQKISFSPPADVSIKQKWKVFGIAAGITFAVLLFWFAGCYPGSFSPDSIEQYEQAVSGNYDDWHPVWHTLLSFTLPLKLTHWNAAIILFQIVSFSLITGYFAFTIYLYSGVLYAGIASALILLSPFTLSIVMFPWKDTAFAMASCLCMLYSIHIYFTKGEWCGKRWKIILFAFMLTNATLLRHNGILFTFFLMAALFFFMPERKWFSLVAMTLLFIALIRFLLYPLLDVTKPGNRVTETSGLPLSVITYVAKAAPEKLDKKTLEFVKDMMKSQPDWKKFYSLSGFNSVKYRGVNFEAIEQVGFSGIWKMTFRCFRRAPEQSLRAAVGLTIPVYGLEVASRTFGGIVKNDAGLVQKGNKIIKSFGKKYTSLIFGTPLQYLFLHIGMTILAMIAFVLFKTDFKSPVDWKRILFFIPIFAYDFGTMLFLTGPDNRFFYVNWFICPLIILIFGRKTVCS